MNALLREFNSPEWTLVVKALLHTLWQGGLVALLLAIGLRLASSAVVRYRLALTALAIVLTSGLITWAMLDHARSAPAIAQAGSAATDFKLTPKEIVGIGEPTVVVVTTSSNTARPAPCSWTAWLALVWILGAGAMLFRAGAQVAGAERLRRSCGPFTDPRVNELLVEARRAIGMARQVRVAVTERLTSPAVVGVLVPTLILPLSLVSTLSHEQIRFILLHELAHIRRGDYLANLFQLFAEALLFFNPAVWWISHEIRREREACCDALAIQLSGAPADYARTLVQVAESALNPPSAAPAFGNNREPSSLSDRVQRLLVPGYRPVLRLTWRAMLGALLLSSALLLISATGTRITVAAILSPEDQPSAVVSNGDSVIRTSRSRQAILNKLETIRLESLSFDSLPLREVVRDLNHRVRLLDPEKKGINILIDPDVGIPMNRQSIDPSSGMLMTNASPTFDIAGVNISIRRALTNVTLGTALDVIMLTANKPITYSLTDSAVIFSPKGPDTDLRTFEVNPQAFIKQLGISSITNPVTFEAAVLQFFWERGLDFSPATGRGFSYRDHDGRLLIRATAEELDRIEKILSSVQAAPQVKREKSNPVNINSGSGNFDAATRIGIFTNDVLIMAGNKSLRADAVRIDGNTGTIEATGRVRIIERQFNNPSNNLIRTSAGRLAIMDKLNNIRLESLSFDSTSLTGAVHHLSAVVSALDPEKKGINFLIAPNVGVSTNLQVIDPTTGLPTTNASPDFDMMAVNISLRSALTNVTLAEALEAIMKSADKPIKYSLTDYAIVFSPKGPETQPHQRTFKVDPQAFMKQLGLTSTTNGTEFIAAVLRFFSERGVDLSPATGRNLYYGDRDGRLMIRATSEELDRVEKALVGLGTLPPPTSAQIQANTFVHNGKLLYESGKLDQAQAELEKALAIDPGNPAAKYYLDLIKNQRSKGASRDSDSLQQTFVHPVVTFTNLAEREFRMDTNNLVLNLVNFGALDSRKLRQARLANDMNEQEQIVGGAMFDWFATNGVEIVYTKVPTMNWNGTTGILQVRAVDAEMRKIEALASTLNKQVPQVNIKVRFIEVPGTGNDILLGTLSPVNTNKSFTDAKPLSNSPGVFPGNHSTASPNDRVPPTAKLVGIVTAPQAKKIIEMFKREPGVNFLSSSELTTLSGRQAQLQIQSAEARTAGQMVTNIVDVIAWVSPDGSTVQLNLTIAFNEFLGFDDPVLPVGNGSTRRFEPIPRYRNHKISSQPIIWDGQTVILSGDRLRFQPSPLARNGDPKTLIALVTTTLIDAAGNRIHTDEDISPAQDQWPVQNSK